jgi:hypothetical protein
MRQHLQGLLATFSIMHLKAMRQAGLHHSPGNQHIIHHQYF